MRVPGLHCLSQRLRPARRRLRARVLRALGRREDAAVQLARSADGKFRQDEIRLLYRAVALAPPEGDLAEIGSWKGRTSIVIASALRDAGIHEARLFAIDHHQGSEELQDVIAREGSTLPVFRRNVRASGLASWIEEMVMGSGEAAPRLRERGVRLRLLFVDGAHDEASVRRDLRSFLPLVVPGGIVALHDCEPDGLFPGVWRAYRTELEPRSEVIGRASSLLVTRLVR